MLRDAPALTTSIDAAERRELHEIADELPGSHRRQVTAGTRSRREFLLASAGALGAVLVPAVARAARTETRAAGATRRFHTRPDLRPPGITVATAAPTVAPGYVFVAPFAGTGQNGPLILDNAGEPVWFLPFPTLTVHNFRVQQLEGKPVLTWWEGQTVNGFFEGDCVIADTSYTVVRRLTGANGLRPEVHEFLITARNTALITSNNFLPADLTAVGGPADATLIESVFQEIDIATGAVLLEWHSEDHVPLDESYFPASATWDYFHLNSVDVDHDGNLLISSRYTSTVYKLDRQSGEIIWRLGGKRSDFELEPGASFAFQHDARGHPGGLVSIFDDGADSPTNAIESTSRAIVLALDTDAMTARLVRAIPNPHGALTIALGNNQLLGTGGAFVGWGTTPEFSEFGPEGKLLFDAALAGGAMSYRAFRQPWSGNPGGRPDIALSGGAGGTLEVFASWNGATNVSHWQVLGGTRPGSLRPLRTVPRTGFETGVSLSNWPGYVAVVALDASGGELGRSSAIAV